MIIIQPDPLVKVPQTARPEMGSDLVLRSEGFEFAWAISAEAQLHVTVESHTTLNGCVYRTSRTGSHDGLARTRSASILQGRLGAKPQLKTTTSCVATFGCCLDLGDVLHLSELCPRAYGCTRIDMLENWGWTLSRF